MQSLILATSLVMSTPVTIDSINNDAKLDALIDSQTQHVTELVVSETQSIAKDTYLHQAKLALQVSREYAVVLTAPVNNDGAE